jgi:hypothetical protein
MDPVLQDFLNDPSSDLSALHDAPALAVLVVREGDGLPGQGWWTGRTDYCGDWVGAQAKMHVRALQEAAFAYWKGRLS